MNYLKTLENGSIKLCCGGNNCPIVTKVSEDVVEIKDDEGNIIRVKPGQAKLISDAVKELDKKDDLLLG